MKYKLIYLTAIILIICSLTAVTAADLNETQTADADDGMELSQDNVLTVNSDENYNSINDSQHDDILNISAEENNPVFEKETDSTSNDDESDDPIYGIVDVGSNTVKLEIYKIKKSGKHKSIFSVSEKSVTAIYCVDNNLTKEGIDELVSILKDFNDIMDLVKAKTKYVFATASLRKINNSAEVIAAVKKKVGLDIHLLTGEQEAEYSFNSVVDKELKTDDGILIDLGGGSCEVIDFANKSIITAESMPIGSNSCYDEYVSGMFPTLAETQEIRDRTLNELKKLDIKNDTQRYDLYGVAGSVKTIRKVLVYLDYIDDDETRIPVSMLDALLNEFSDPTKENYEKIMDVDVDRINTFIPGLIITKTIAEYFNVTYLHFCKNGIREGILKEIIKNETRNPIELTVNDIDITSDENGEILVKLPTNTTGTITVKLGDYQSASSLENGTCLIVLPKLNPGNYTAKITYSGDDNYLSNTTKITVHVKIPVLHVYDMTRGWNSDYDYQVKLTDEAGNGIANKLIVFTILENQYYAMTDSNGFATIKPKLVVGTYTVKVSSGITADTSKTLKIVKRIENNKNLNVYYNSNAKYKVKVIGDDGNCETQGKNVDVIINNKKYTYKTDKNGFIEIALNKNFNPGTHTIKIQYKEFSVENKMTIKHTLKSKKVVKVKKQAKKIVLTAKLSKKLKNQVIKFKIKGKTYTAKTNNNGIAKKTIKNNYKKGKYAVKISYLKDTIQASVKIL